jgi:Peptidase_C39 like family
MGKMVSALLGVLVLGSMASAQSVNALTKFIEPKDPRGEAAAKTAFEEHLKKNGPNPSPSVTKARAAYQDNYSGKGPYWGINGLYWYNNDGAQSKDLFGKVQDDSWRSCGQAAAATVRRLWKVTPANDFSDAPVRNLYNRFPADGYLGVLGTSWQRVRSMLQDGGLSVQIIKGENDLKNSVANGNPVIVMLDCGKFPEWNYQFAGHWVVVYGYTRSRVYLSNWKGDGSTTWENFRKGWINNVMVNGGGMSEMGIVGTGRSGRLGQ